MRSRSESPPPTGAAFEIEVGTQDHGGPVNNPAKAMGLGRPGAGPSSHSRRAGSNSHGDCRHCPRAFALRNGRVPNHHAPLTGHRGPHPICPGSGESPASYADADGSDLLEA